MFKYGGEATLCPALGMISTDHRPSDATKQQHVLGMTGKLPAILTGDTMSQPSPILQFFAYKHLKPDLQAVSKPFGELAEAIERDLPSNPEKSVALRKLLEAKDAAVRAFLFKNSQ